MMIDLTTPEAFAVSGAAFAWFVIEKLLKPLLTDNWRWFHERTDGFRYGFWTLLILAVLTPVGWVLFHDWATVIPCVLAAVVGSQWTYGVVKGAGVVDERLERVASRAGVRVAELGEL